MRNNTVSFGANFADIRNRKRRQAAMIREGVIVNTFIKNSSSENFDIPMKETPLPADMFNKKNKKSEAWYKNPIIPIIAVPLVFLGAGAGLAKAFKTSYLKKYGLGKNKRIPPQGRIIAINDDSKMSLLMLVQDPNWKNFQVAAAVIAASAAGFVMKNTVDGFREVLVKKQAADIKRDKEERLIDIETRAFSGKNQIVRSLLDKTTRDLNNYERIIKNPKDKGNFTFGKLTKKLSFGANKTEPEDKKDSSKTSFLYVLSGLAVLGTAALLTKSIFRNLGSVTKKINKHAAEAQKSFKKDLGLLAKKPDLENELKTSQISDGAKDYVREEWLKKYDPSAMEVTPELMTGKRGKTGISSVVLAEASSFIYTWMLDPKNPQTKALATLMCSFAGLSYVGQAVIKGVKDVQVAKADADTEVDLQDSLVQVELKNFFAKKRSFIAPITADTKERIRLTDSTQAIKQLKENALAEIKNGPPFVYS